MPSPEQQLRVWLSADQEPVLSDEEIGMLLDSNQKKLDYLYWAPNTDYSVGTRVVPFPRNGNVYVVTVAGTSGNTQPVFPEFEDATVEDNDVTWQQDDVEASYNLRKAAAEGWRIKAGKVANRYDFKTDVTDLKRSQMYKQFMDLAKMYARGTAGTIKVNPPERIFDETVIGNLNPAP